MSEVNKVSLRIEDFEDKKGATGKRYTRFKTDQDWMSAFDKPIIEKLKDACEKQQIVSVGITVDAEKGWKNIRKFYGIGAGETTQPEANKTNGNGKKNFTAMYTSYAKDLFIKLVELVSKEGASGYVSKNVMQESIDLVKQAREAFE